jgi:Domain of unknown function (DUF4159)/Aerotolerance regulator N-terminal
MIDLPLAFSSPMILLAVIGLPLLYYFLRTRPPRPDVVIFPPFLLLRDISAHTHVAATCPWWLLMVRMLMAACLIAAAAGPVWNPLLKMSGDQGPLVLVLDDSWLASSQWPARVNVMLDYLADAERRGRAVALVRASDGARDISVASYDVMRERIHALKPVSFVPDDAVLSAPLQQFISRNPHSHIVWVSDGVAHQGARALAHDLDQWAGHDDAIVDVISDDRIPRIISGVSGDAAGFDIKIMRASSARPAQGFMRALDMKGRVIARTDFDMGAELTGHSLIHLPLDIRNDVARLDIEDEHSAGSVYLLDDHAHRVSVGLVSGEAFDSTQPLLSASYYITRAMQPFADVRQKRDDVNVSIDALLRDQPSVLVMADVGSVSVAATQAITHFLDEGGVVVRFAGPHMLSGSDTLVPVRVRRGGRVMGGALSWEKPRHIAPPDQTSPLYGLSIPDDVIVSQQLLAEPDAGLRAATWLALDDGTPLITAATRGRGLLILVHVTADTHWSNLPLSGLFVDVLRRVADMAHRTKAGASDEPYNGAVTDQTQNILAPSHVLDGFGVLGPPPASARAINDGFVGPVSADHPAGYYGAHEGQKALNAVMPSDLFPLLDLRDLHLRSHALRAPAPIDLRALLLVMAVLLFICDGLASLWLSGAFMRQWRALALLLCAVLCGALGMAHEGHAQPKTTDAPLTARMREHALSTHLAYVITGDGRTDDTSRLGLAALSRALAARTSLQPAEPVGVDLERDDLSLFPLLYWPIVAQKPQPSTEAVARMARFMRQGGTIVFDTRDALSQRAGTLTPEGDWLRRLLGGVDVPPLQIVPSDHVVTKTFYLLTRFVGRTALGDTWIEALPPQNADGGAGPVRAGDNVSPLIITSNDLAGAWATNAYGTPLYQLIPNDERQREMALRGGINLVMYTLTGNYKADQVHVRDLLERLGH